MRIIMHAPANLLETHGHHEAIKKNLINSNHGELLFPFSVSRALMLDDVEIEYCNFLQSRFAIEPSEINERYDCLVLPFANVLRAPIVPKLRALTDYIKQITIPVVVPCIGWQGGIDKEPDTSSEQDAVIKGFCNAILEKSPLIGVRGESTGRFLEHLGFKAEEHFMVLGCPSMYLHGDSLPDPKPLNLTRDSRLNINNKITLPYKIHRFMRTIADEYPNSYYIPQNLYEVKLVYSGIPLVYTWHREISHPKYYPLDLSDRLYVEDRVRAFVDVTSWFEFLKKGELNIGTRIHGNIAGVLCGNPTFIIACDARVDELASYHNIPHMRLKELPERPSLEDIVSSVDFRQIHHGHKERFERYLDFWHKSELATVFDNGTPEITRFDQLVGELQFPGPIVTLAAAPLDSFKERMDIWSDSMKLFRQRREKNENAGKVFWEKDEEMELKQLKKSLARADR